MDDPARTTAPETLTAVAPGIAPTLQQFRFPPEPADEARPILRTCALAVVVAILASLAARVLTALIGLVTNVAFYHRVSTTFVSPSGHHLGALVILVPIVGGLIVGAMARWGSPAIRGHGIPEAMEQVLLNESRIAPRVTFLKPLSAAVAIGTGGPFGAEGPIIATGGALGSLLGQLQHSTADERKILLAAGAAAGTAAIFGSPVAAILLAVELLLFEYRPRSLIPVSLAAVVAMGIRIAFDGSTAVFQMAPVAAPGGEALVAYVVLGALMGGVAVAITRALYAVEDGFERLPIHWMWWPALGAVAVGVAGVLVPRTLGVGYENITDILNGAIVGRVLVALVVVKFAAWVIALGSGTSGGTLAPLFTVGGGLGALLGAMAASALPSMGIDPRIAALVGMASLFTGASHALLASVAFAFETTRQPMGLLPILAGSAAAYLVSLAFMRHTIMTERLARRGTSVRPELEADWLTRILVRDIASRTVVTLRADDAVEEVRDWIADRADGSSHQGFPVVDAERLVGVVTRRDLLDLSLEVTARVGELVRRAPVVIREDHTAREAADHMVREGVGRLPVVSAHDPRRVVGIVTRSDILKAHEHRLHAMHRSERTLELSSWRGASTP